MSHSLAYAAFQIPDYRRFLLMRLMTTLTIQIMAVSVGYYVYELTEDPLKLGFIGLAEAIPAIGVSLWAGHLTDKTSRRKILVFCTSVMLLCALSLFAVTVFRSQLSVVLQLTFIYSILFGTGIARAFFSPANFAFLPQIVDRERLQNAVNWNSSTWEISSIAGLAIGGVVYGYGGVSAAFGLMGIFSAMALLAILQIAPREVPTYNQEETVMERIKAGLHFVFSKQIMLSAIVLDLLVVLFGGVVALMPVFAKDILKVGPEGAGMLRAAMAAGAFLMTFVLAYRPLTKGAGRALLVCVAGFGFCTIAFGLSTNFYLSMAIMLLAGVFDEVSVFVRAAMIQFQTPENMKGRVTSVSTIFITSSNEIGAFESGLAASLMGTVPSVIFGGLMTLGIVAVSWYKAPKLREYDIER